MLQFVKDSQQSRDFWETGDMTFNFTKYDMSHWIGNCHMYFNVSLLLYCETLL